MNSWKYRAYDATNAVHEGLEQANDFPSLALKLRQKGLQILEATKLTPDNALGLSRLEQLKARVNPPPPTTTKTDEGRIRRLVNRLIHLFRR